MIRIYCDSNIYRLLKPTSKQFNQTVFDHFENIRKNAVIAFSEAHLDDLRTSNEKYRDEDLELMEKYTGDFYIYYNQNSKNWDCFLATPKDAFKDRDYVTYDQALNNPFNFRSLVADLGDFPGKEELCALMDSFMQTPISTLGLGEIASNDSDGNKDMLKKIIPGYDPNMGIGTFFQSISPYISKLLCDYQEFNELRRSITSFVDTNDYKYEKWGLAFDEQLEKTTIGKKFTDIIKQLSVGGERDDWRQFQQAYSMLEMLGITEERAGGKRKRNNLMDLTKDCAHAFNAMSCDYFITNDKGLLVKAQILYHIFQVDRTKIIMLDELNEFSLSKPIDDSFNSLISVIDSFTFNFGEKRTASTFNLEGRFLHYFDLVSRVKANEKVFILSASKGEGQNFMYREILKICEKTFKLWGDDGYGKGLVKLEELSTSESLMCLRTWVFNDACVQLKCDSTNRGFYIVIIFK